VENSIMSYRNHIMTALLGAAILGGLGAAFAFRQKPDDDRPPRGKDKDKDKEAPVVITGRLTPEQAAAEQAAIRKQIDAFSKAYNKGDLDGVMAMWTEDAEFINEYGKAFRGKERIRILLKKALAGAKGSKQSVKVTSLRFIKPDVAIEEGVATVEGKSDIDIGKYEAVWIKLDGKWYMSRVRDLPDAVAEEQPPAIAKLKPLAWLVGEWVDKNNKEVTLSGKFGPGQTFILQELKIKQGGKLTTIQQRIGYDPVEDRIVSWVFDDGGGFADCVWERDGNTWVTDNNGTVNDGRKTTATVTWKYLGDDSFSWSVKDREVDEQPLPDIEVTFIRKKGS
jgi:uncharacterized protein (TIGR02246 family)